MRFARLASVLQLVLLLAVLFFATGTEAAKKVNKVKIVSDIFAALNKGDLAPLDKALAPGFMMYFDSAINPGTPLVDHPPESIYDYFMALGYQPSGFEVEFSIATPKGVIAIVKHDATNGARTFEHLHSIYEISMTKQGKITQIVIFQDTAAIFDLISNKSNLSPYTLKYFNTRYFGLLSAHAIDNVIAMYVADAKISTNGSPSSLANLRAEAESFIASFPDIVYDILDVHAEADAVVSEVVVKGTHTGAAFAGVPSKGNKIHVHMMFIHHINNDGTIASTSTFLDVNQILAQVMA